MDDDKSAFQHALERLYRDMYRGVQAISGREIPSLFYACIVLAEEGRYGAQAFIQEHFTQPDAPLMKRLQAYYMTALAQKSCTTAEARGLYEEAEKPIIEATQAGVSEAARALLARWVHTERRLGPEPRLDGAYAHLTFFTTQEMDALSRAVADGRLALNWEEVAEAKLFVYKTPGQKSHQVKIALTTQDERDGLTLDFIEQLIGSQSARMVAAIHWACEQLIPAEPLPFNETTSVEFELDKMMRALHWGPTNRAQRIEYRRELWQMFQFVARAQVIGERTYPVYESEGGKKQLVPTRIDNALWRIDKEVFPEYVPFGEERVPTSLWVTALPEFAYLLRNKATAQYIHESNVLLSFPREQPTGAWAHSIGLALLNIWRREPKMALEGTLRPSRYELLTRYTPHVAPVTELLERSNAARAFEYWHQALRLLADQERGFLAAVEEADPARTPEAERARFPRREWGREWLREKVTLLPGEVMKPPLEELTKRRGTRPGRPSSR